MFNALDNLKKTHKKELNRKLTQPMITKITNTYATNLKNNAPDPVKMKLGVLGGIFHMSSTDKQPNHKHCPSGENSWCKYNRAIATNTPPPPHKPTFKPDILPIIYPTIKRLTDIDLLKRCGKMLTQNANESFNATIWSRCRKTEFSKRENVETAVALATLAFNCGPYGIVNVMDKLGLKYNNILHTHVQDVVKKKVLQARTKKSGISKWKRKNKKVALVEQQHSREEKEGPTYQSGAFNC